MVNDAFNEFFFALLVRISPWFNLMARGIAGFLAARQPVSHQVMGRRIEFVEFAQRQLVKLVFTRFVQQNSCLRTVCNNDPCA